MIDIAAVVREIEADNRSGATAVTERVAALLTEAVKEPTEAFQSLALALVRAQPCMASVLRVVNAALLAGESHPEGRGERVRQAVGEVLACLHRHAAEAAAHAATLLGGARVLTHSASSLVARALLKAHAQRPLRSVTCTESRPMREGVDLAQQLGASGIPVHFVIDALAPALVSQSDLLVLGADAVCVAGVVHKVGTLGLVLAARHFRVPTYVVATDEKFLPEACGAAPPIPERDPREVLAERVPGVRPYNVYFDRTPLECFSGIVTEQGFMDPERILRRLREIEVHRSLEGLWPR